MARFHEFTEKVEVEVFCPVSEFIWEKYLSNADLDGQLVFYYTMEYMSRQFPELDMKTAFEVAEDIMQQAWDLHYTRMEAEREAEEAVRERQVEEYANNYDNFDDLPWS